MKIAIFHELPDGGAKNATKTIGKLLKSYGHTVDLYYSDLNPDSDLRNYKFDNIYFYKFVPKVWHGNNWKVRFYKDTIELFKTYALHKTIANEINLKEYDIVFINASKFIESPFTLRFINSFKVFYAHDPNYRFIYEKLLDVSKDLKFIKFTYEKINRYVRKLLDASNIKKADLILANSEFAKQIIFKTYSKKSIVAYLGVDEKLFKPKEVKKEIDILFVGSKDELDGYSLLKSALLKLKSELRVESIPEGNRKILTSLEMVNMYQKSKIVVCLAVNEPFGLVPLEAMPCEVPVIAVDEGGYKETVINNKTGFLIKRDSNLLAGKIKQLLDNPDLAKEMGRNGREEILKKWTWEKRGKELEKILLHEYENFNNNS